MPITFYSPWSVFTERTSDAVKITQEKGKGQCTVYMVCSREEDEQAAERISGQRLFWVIVMSQGGSDWENGVIDYII